MTTIGIDLGTTNSAIAYHDGTTWELIESSSGHVLMPSVVAVDRDGQITVGHQALRKLKRDKNPEYIFTNIKRHIGMPFVEGEDYGSQIVNIDGMRWFRGPNDQAYSPEELSAEILKALKDAAERKLRKKVKNAVITVPAGFDNNRIAATRDAGIMAGFKNPIIKTEPEMAALAFGLHKVKLTRMAIFDLGGGTFDIAIGQAAKGKIDIHDKDGNALLGGADFDESIWRWVVDSFLHDEGQDLRKSATAKLKTMPAIEDAKKELTDAERSVIMETNIGVNYDNTAAAVLDVNYAISREKFDELTRHLVENAIAITKRLLERNNKTVRDFDEVLLVGGMTRVPAVRKAVEDLFGGKRIRDDVNPDHAVAKGAAIAAAQEDGVLPARFSFTDVTASAFGIEDKAGNFIVAMPRGAKAGDLQELLVTTAQDGQPTIPIAVLEGEPGSRATDCAVLTRYEHRVEPGPKRTPRINLQFMIDESGQVMVTGHDRQTDTTFTIREP